MLASFDSKSIRIPSLFSSILRAKLIYVFNYIPSSKFNTVLMALGKIDSESQRILEERQRNAEPQGGGSDGIGKDLLTLLRKATGLEIIDLYLTRLLTVKANSGDTKTRMSTEELRGQLPVRALSRYCGVQCSNISCGRPLYLLDMKPRQQQIGRAHV